MKEKAEICPKCKGRLFLSNRDGTKTCASCGETIGIPIYEAGKQRKADAAPAPVATATCPSCGSQASYVATDDRGQDVYACAFCGNRFSPKKAAAPSAPVAPAAPKKDEELDGKEIFALAKANTVEILATFTEGAGAGSGFFIAPGYILTNAHVVTESKKNDPIGALVGEVQPAKKVVVCFKGGKQHKAEIKYYDRKEDMAVLHTDLACSKVASISSDMPETGETIYAVGNSAGQGMCIMEGLVADQLREVADNQYMMISANIVGGNSGGPIFNKKGQVVGIVTLGSRDAVAMNYGIPVPRIREFLKASKLFKINN